MTNFEKIIILLVSLLIIIVLVLGVAVLGQQKAIRNLESGSALSKTTSGQSSKTGNQTSESPALIPGKKFGGEITAISENDLTVKASLIDYSKPKNSEKTEFEHMEKSVKVSVNADTRFVNRKLADLKVGDVVNISAKESAYDNDSVTAEAVSYVGPAQ